jgi:hypothetical protein
LPKAVLQSVDCYVKTALATLLAADAGNFKDKLFHVSTSQPTRASHPVIIQIGDTQDFEADTPGTLTDPSRKIAGVGLLVREAA